MALKRFFDTLGKKPTNEGGNMEDQQHQGQGEASSAGPMPVDIDPSDPNGNDDETRPAKEDRDDDGAMCALIGGGGGGDPIRAHYYEGEGDDRRAVRGTLVVDSSGAVRFEAY